MAWNKPKYKPRCQIVNCGKTLSDSPDLTFHRVPKALEKRSLWLKKIGKKNVKSLSTRFFICSLHFEDADFLTIKTANNEEKRHLRTTAVPSKFPWTKDWDLPAENDNANENVQVAKLKIYRCQTCGYVTNNKSSYDRHSVKHVFVCEACNYQASSQKKLHRHVERNHKSEVYYKCSQCTFTSEQRSTTARHIGAKSKKDKLHRKLARVIQMKRAAKQAVEETETEETGTKERKEEPAEDAEECANEMEEIEEGEENEQDDNNDGEDEDNDREDEETSAKAEENEDETIAETNEEQQSESNHLEEDSVEETKAAEVSVEPEEPGNNVEEESAGEEAVDNEETIRVCKICLCWSTSPESAALHENTHFSKPYHCSVCFATFEKHAGIACHIKRRRATPNHADAKAVVVKPEMRDSVIITLLRNVATDGATGQFSEEDHSVRDLITARESLFQPAAQTPRAKKKLRSKERKKQTVSKAVGEKNADVLRKVYVCPQCGFWSSVCDLFAKHLKTHGIEKKRHRCSACGQLFSWMCRARVHIAESQKSGTDHENAQVISSDEGVAAYVTRIESSVLAGKNKGYLKDKETTQQEENHIPGVDLPPTTSAEVASDTEENVPESSSNMLIDLMELLDNGKEAFWYNRDDDMMSISSHREQEEDLRIESVFHLSAGFCSEMPCLDSLMFPEGPKSVEDLTRKEESLRTQLKESNIRMNRSSATLKDLLETITVSRKTMTDLEHKYTENADKLTQVVAHAKEIQFNLDAANQRLRDAEKNLAELSAACLQTELSLRSKQVDLIKLQINKSPEDECKSMTTEVEQLEAIVRSSKEKINQLKTQLEEDSNLRQKLESEKITYERTNGDFVKEMKETESRVADLRAKIKEANGSVEIVLSKRIELMNKLIELRYSLEIVRVNKILRQPDYDEILMAEVNSLTHQQTQTDSCSDSVDAATSTEELEVSSSPTAESECMTNLVETADSTMEEETPSGNPVSVPPEAGSLPARGTTDSEISIEVELEADPNPAEKTVTLTAGTVPEPGEALPEPEPETTRNGSTSADPVPVITATPTKTSSSAVTKSVPGLIRVPDLAQSTPVDQSRTGSLLRTAGNDQSRSSPVIRTTNNDQSRTSSVARTANSDQLRLISGQSRSIREKIMLTSEVTLTEVKRNDRKEQSDFRKEIIVRMAPLDDPELGSSDEELVDITPVKEKNPKASLFKTEPLNPGSRDRKQTERESGQRSDLSDDVVFLSANNQTSRRKQVVETHSRNETTPGSSSAATQFPRRSGQPGGSQRQSSSSSQNGSSSSLVPVSAASLCQAKGSAVQPTGSPGRTVSTASSSVGQGVLLKMLNEIPPPQLRTYGSLPTSPTASTSQQHRTVNQGRFEPPPPYRIPENLNRLSRPPQTVIPRSNIVLVRPNGHGLEGPADKSSRPADPVVLPVPMISVASFAKDFPGPETNVRIPVSPPAAIAQRPPGLIFRQPVSQTIAGFLVNGFQAPPQSEALRPPVARPPINRTMRPF